MVSWFLSLSRWRRLVVIGFALLLAIHLTAILHRRTTQGGDFDGHRNFGMAFLQRFPSGPDGGCFNYMTISAMYYSPLAMAPAPVTFTIRYMVAIVCLCLTFQWMLGMLPESTTSTRRFVIVALALVLTLKYIIRDLDDGGPHLILLSMLVGGTHLLRRGKEAASGVCFALAIVLKMTPGLLLPYFAWKRRWRLLTITMIAMAALIVAPALWLGPSVWWSCQEEWNEYLYYVISGKENWDLDSNNLRVQNQSLKLAVLNGLMTYPAGHPLHRSSEILSVLDLPAGQAHFLANLVLAGLLGVFWWRTRRRDSATTTCMPLELAGLLLLMVLLSPVTWLQHLVFALPAVFFILADERRKPWPMRIALGAYMVLALLLNREILGRENYLSLLACHIHTVAMLILLGLVLWLRARKSLDVAALQGDRTNADGGFVGAAFRFFRLRIHLSRHSSAKAKPETVVR